MRTYAIINQKGGCGKTTTAINLAGILARRGCRTLLVDLDPQSHCAAGLAIPDDRIDIDIGDAMKAMIAGDRFDHDRLVWRIARNLDLVPSRMSLAGLEAGRGGLATAAEREHCLARLLRQLDEHARAARAADTRDISDVGNIGDDQQITDESGYDLVCIDCPPSIGLLTYNAIVASSEILVPVESSFFSLQGATKQVQTIKALGRKLGVTPTVRLIATLHDESSALSRDIYEELQRRFGDAVLPFMIRFDHAIRESASFGRPVVEYAPHSTGAQDYGRLAEWLMTREGVQASDLPFEDFDPGSSPVVTPLDRINAEAKLAAWGSGDGHMMADPERDPASVVVTDAAHVGNIRPTHSGPAESNEVPADIQSTDRPDDLEHLDRLDRHGERARDVIRRAQRMHEAALAHETASASKSTPVPHRGAEHVEADDTFNTHGPVHMVDSQPPSMPDGALVAPGSDAPPLPQTDPPLVSVRRLFGVRQTARGMLFVQPLSIGRKVCVAGSFNGWAASTHRMRENPLMGVHELLLPLDTGQHEYRLVVDGVWRIDPYNDDRQLNSFGEENCVARVGHEGNAPTRAPDPVQRQPVQAQSEPNALTPNDQSKVG